MSKMHFKDCKVFHLCHGVGASVAAEEEAVLPLSPSDARKQGQFDIAHGTQVHTFGG